MALKIDINWKGKNITTLRCTAELNERPSIPVINILTSVPSSTHGAHIRLLLNLKDQPADPCSACDICSRRGSSMSESYTEKDIRHRNWVGGSGYQLNQATKERQDAVIIASIPNVSSGFTTPGEDHHQLKLCTR